MSRIKLNLVAEIKAENVMEARRILDAFRESALPSETWGISLYENYQIDRLKRIFEQANQLFDAIDKENPGNVR